LPPSARLKGLPCEKNFERVNSRGRIDFLDHSSVAEHASMHIKRRIERKFYLQEVFISQTLLASREIASKKI
jgi:hypothetical protein